MRTQDLDHYERLARRLSRGAELDPEEVARVLLAVDHTHDDLLKRAEYFRGRWAQYRGVRGGANGATDSSPLERYQEETKVAGIHEGLMIVVGPMVVLSVFLLALIAAVAL